MSWKDIFISSSELHSAYSTVIQARIADLTKICVSVNSDVDLIRAAQSGINELLRLERLPAQLRAELTQSKTNGRQ